jgi:hypothetical protein
MENPSWGSLWNGLSYATFWYQHNKVGIHKEWTRICLAHSLPGLAPPVRTFSRASELRGWLTPQSSAGIPLDGQQVELVGEVSCTSRFQIQSQRVRQ